MNCHDIRNAIYVYLDGEFAGPEELDFQRHVDQCADCRELLKTESDFLAAFKAQLDTPRAPESLRRRVEETLVTASGPPPSTAAVPRSRWRIAAPLAVAAGIAALAVVSLHEMGATARPVVEEAIAAHQSDLPMEARGSDDHVRNFLQEHVPFAVEIPFTDVDGIRLVGARLTRYNGHQAVLFNFDADGERVSVLQVAAPHESAADTMEPVRGHKAGYQVVTYRHKGLTNSVVGKLGPAQLNQMTNGLHRQPLLKRASFSR